MLLQKQKHPPVTQPQTPPETPQAHPSPPTAIPPAGPPVLQGQRTLLLSRRIGYGLLILCLVDLLYVLLPPQFTNAVWEYQAIGDSIKLVPVLLLALMLVFQGETGLRSQPERLALRGLSWFSLGAGIILFLLVPLVVSNTIRINRFNNDQITTQVSQQRVQLETTRKQLERAEANQFRNFVPRPDQAGNLPDAPTTPEQAKKQLLANVDRAKEQANVQAVEARKNVRRNLIKNTIKLTLEALLSAFFFCYIWAKTGWARRAASYKNEPMRPSSLARLLRPLGIRL